MPYKIVSHVYYAPYKKTMWHNYVRILYIQDGYDAREGINDINII